MLYILLIIIFFDNLITGGNNKEDLCPGKQNCVRDERSARLNFSPFHSLLLSHLLWRLSPLAAFLFSFLSRSALNHYISQGWSSDHQGVFIYTWFHFHREEMCACSIQNYYSLMKVLYLKMNREHGCYSNISLYHLNAIFLFYHKLFL